MARINLARTGALVTLALTLAACGRDQDGDNARAALPTEVAFARNAGNAGGNGGGKGGGVAVEQPSMAITPTTLSLAVGAQFTVQVTYWDRRGAIIPTTDEKIVYYGCQKLQDTDADCYSVLQILPMQPFGREAQITGKAPGTVQLWASDGLGTTVTSTVTVQ
jgi:hypothetical protein